MGVEGWKYSGIADEVRSSKFRTKNEESPHLRNSKFRFSRGAKLEDVTSATAPATCPRCNGSGWVPLPGDALRVEPCGCQGDLRRRQRITAAGIPPRYYHCRLET